MRPTTLVRRAMYAQGASKWGVFTNSYEKCHTIKMYGDTDKYNQQVVAAIAALGIPGLTVKVLANKRIYAGCGVSKFRPSIIARIPK